MKCGKSVEDDAEAFCHDCAAGEKSFEYGVALLNYDDVMRRAVSRIKYNNRREYIKPFAKMFWMRWGKTIAEMEADCLVPVPLHPTRYRKPTSCSGKERPKPRRNSRRTSGSGICRKLSARIRRKRTCPP